MYFRNRYKFRKITENEVVRGEHKAHYFEYICVLELKKKENILKNQLVKYLFLHELSRRSHQNPKKVLYTMERKKEGNVKNGKEVKSQ